MRAAIEQQVEQTDVLADIDIKEVTREAKIGWIKRVVIIAVWPLIKKELLRHINARIVQVIENVIGII